MFLCYPHDCLQASLFHGRMVLISANSLKIRCSRIHSSKNVIILVTFYSNNNLEFMYESEHQMNIFEHLHSTPHYFSKHNSTNLFRLC